MYFYIKFSIRISCKHNRKKDEFKKLRREKYEYRYIKIALPLLLEGLKTTICISILAILLSFIFGGLIGILYISKNKVFHLIAYVYIKIFRNIPFMVQVYLVYYALPSLGLNVDAFGLELLY